MARAKQTVGLDLGARNVRAVWVQLHNGQPRVLRAEKMELPLESGDSAALIRAWLEQLGLGKGFASIAIPGTKLVFQPGKLTPDDPRTVRQAADMELTKFNDLVGDTMTCDVTSYSCEDKSRPYLMSMSRPSIVSSTLASLEPLGIRPTDLVPSPAALFCALAPLYPQNETPVLYVDIGHTKTDIAIGTSKGLLFARSFAVGGKQFTDAIAKGGACSLQLAESQKLREGTLRPGGAFSEFLTPVAERWFSQFSAVLAAYRSSVPVSNTTSVTSITIIGGASQLPGFKEWLATRSQLRVNGVESFRPLPGITDLSTYAVAIGLALSSMEAPGIARLSLIPPYLRDEVIFCEKKPYWIATALTLSLTLCVFTGGLIYMLGRETEKIDAERQELRKREKIDSEIAKIRQETESIHEKILPLKSLLAGGATSRFALSLIATSLESEDWISLISDEETYLSNKPAEQIKSVLKPAKPGFFVPGFRDNDPKAKKSSEVFTDAEAKPAPKKSEFKAFIIEGYTPNMGLESVDTMMRRIRSSEKIKSVDLLSDDKVQPPAELPDFINKVKLPEMRRFVIRMEVVQQ